MALNKADIKQAAESLIAAAESKAAIAPLTETYPGIAVEEAYQVQLLTVEHGLAAGRKIVGKKIGLTSPAIQEQLGVDERDYGHLFEDMLAYQGMPFDTARLMQPRIEGEIAFVLGDDLVGPGVTPTDVLRATGGVCAALEIIDSRVADWKIKIQDTVADNASGAALVLGAKLVPAIDIDLRHVGFVLTKNGQLAGTGAGAAVLGSPAQSVAWLANKLGQFGIPLKAGEIILSGAASAAVPVAPGDSIHLHVDRIGEVACYFA